jgi:glutathione S-transferase
MLPRLTLHSSPNSPFARRVRSALRRLALPYEEFNQENLFPAPPSFLQINPLGLVPALVVEGKDPVVDSSAILEFLDDTVGGIWPKDHEERWAAKRVSTLATGILTEAVAWRVESTRPDARAEAQRTREQTIQRILPGFTELPRRKPQWWRKPNQALFDVGIAIEYLKFRLHHVDWSEHLGSLEEELFIVLDDIPAFAETAPPGFKRF